MAGRGSGTRVTRMRLVLHIGMPKTGTSALQYALAANRRLLVEQGILYPAFGKTTNHNLLAALLSDEASAPRRMRHSYAGRWPELEARAQSAWRQVEAEAEALRPHTLVLSGEYLFTCRRPERTAAFCDLLRRVTEEISVLAYIRQPSKLYASAVQQELKLSGRFRPPAPLTVRPQIEAWSAAFPGAVTVAAYDREALVGGDIVTDFLARALPGAPVRLEHVAARNETISAEAMAVLQDVNRRWYCGFDDRPASGKRALLYQLKELDRSDPSASRPRLHPAVAEYLDRSSVDLLWLRDAHGVRFRGVDYDRIDPTLQPPPARDVADICLVDAARKARLARRALNPLTRAWWKRLGNLIGRRHAAPRPLAAK
jgi:hypothetical protein